MNNKYLFGWLLIFSGLFFLDSHSQVTGKVSYLVILESENFKELEATLYFSDVESYFFVDLNSGESNSKKYEEVYLIDETNIHFDFDFSLKRPTRYEVYINQESKNILSQSSIFKDGFTTPYVVQEATGSINWQIIQEFKKIGSLKVQRATTKFRGRNYNAWFTTEIPVAVGPWKFHGLPGLIIEIQDDELGVQFLFSSIEIPFQIEDKIKPPNDGSVMLLSDYIKYDNSFEEEFIKLFKAKLPRDVTISEISVNKVKKSIEREYQR